MHEHIDVEQLHTAGIELSTHFNDISKVSKELMALHPTHIKLLIFLAHYLKSVQNNEISALELYEKAKNYYDDPNVRQRVPISGYQDQNQVFGENSGCTCVVVSGNSKTMGKIMQVNKEAKVLLGYTQAELVGRSISMVMPSIFA